MNRPAAFKIGDRIVYDFVGGIRSGVILEYVRGTYLERDTYLVSTGPRWLCGGRWVSVTRIRNSSKELT